MLSEIEQIPQISFYEGKLMLTKYNIYIYIYRVIQIFSFSDHSSLINVNDSHYKKCVSN